MDLYAFQGKCCLPQLEISCATDWNCQQKQIVAQSYNKDKSISKTLKIRWKVDDSRKPKGRLLDF